MVELVVMVVMVRMTLSGTLSAVLRNISPTVRFFHLALKLTSRRCINL